MLWIASAVAVLAGDRTVRLAWDPGTEIDLAGYLIIYGFESGRYPFTKDVGNVTETEIELPVGGQRYHFAAVAYNTEGLRSGPSDEVSVQFATGPNDPPVRSFTLTTTEDRPVFPSFNYSVTGGGPSNVQFVITRSAAHGAVLLNGSSLSFVPTPNFFGTDDFDLLAMTGESVAAKLAFTVNVTPLNDRPVVRDQSFSVPLGQSLRVPMTGFDADGDPLNYRILVRPAHGTLREELGAVVYTPAAGYWGTDGFQFVLHDGRADSTVAKVALQVGEMGSDVYFMEVVEAREDLPVAVNLPAGGAGPASQGYKIIFAPRFGDLSGNPPQLTYRSHKNYYGLDDFVVWITDGPDAGLFRTVWIRVSPVNNPPIAMDSYSQVPSDHATPVGIVIRDVDGDSLTVRVISGPSHGMLRGEWPNQMYWPVADFEGPDSFRFVVSDGVYESTPATVYLEVVNAPPQASDNTVTVNEDSSVEILLAAQDPTGDDLSYQIVAPPAFGTLEGVAPRLIYRPSTNFFGTDRLVFSATDSHGRSAQAAVSITVAPVLEPPPKLDIVPVGNGELELTWVATPGWRYRVLHQAGIEGTGWVPISDFLVATSTVLRWRTRADSVTTVGFFIVDLLRPDP